MLFLLVIITGGLVALARARPYLLVGWLWFLGMLVPVIGVVQISTYAHADRYTYLPQIGLWILLVWAVADIAHRFCLKPWLIGGGALASVAGLAFVAHQQVRHWKDGEALWNHTLACTKLNYTAYTNLGGVMAEKGNLEDAIALYQYALTLKPDMALAHNNLAFVLMQQGQLDKAAWHVRRALEVNPRYAEALDTKAIIMKQLGQLSEAAALDRRALEIKPEFAFAHSNLAGVLIDMGQLDEALAHGRRALEIDPHCVEAYNNTANALLRKGRMEEAISLYRQALQIDSNQATICNNLAWILAVCQDSRLRDEANAEQLARRAVELTRRGNAAFLGTLALVLACQGRDDEARDTFEEALRLADAQGQTVLVEMLQQQMRAVLKSK